MNGRPRLSVVIPALNEAHHLPALLEDLSTFEPLEPEVIVVDGGSIDRTREVACEAGVRCLETSQSRGRQLRRGAAAANGDWLLFLHADSRLDRQAVLEAQRFMAHAEPNQAAHFRFQLDGSRSDMRRIEAGQRLRERLLGLVYGDQGLIISRHLYDQVGGYPDWPIMEDVGLVDAIRRRGRIERLDAPLTTSARRYDRIGAKRGSVRNAALIAAFRLGVPPTVLAGLYPAQPSRRRVVALFVKAPLPGYAKTRLSRDLGEEVAIQIYRKVGRAAADELRRGDWALRVFADGPDQSTFEMIAEWLGVQSHEIIAQTGDHLGERMSSAIRYCLQEYDDVCVVGSDIPGITPEIVQRAFDALRADRIALGPCHDGGYYLLACSRAIPQLFDQVPWSSPHVLDATLERAAASEIEVTLLDRLADIDVADDVPSWLLESVRTGTDIAS